MTFFFVSPKLWGNFHFWLNYSFKVQWQNELQYVAYKCLW